MTLDGESTHFQSCPGWSLMGGWREYHNVPKYSSVLIMNVITFQYLNFLNWCIVIAVTMVNAPSKFPKLGAQQLRCCLRAAAVLHLQGSKSEAEYYTQQVHPTDDVVSKAHYVWQDIMDAWTQKHITKLVLSWLLTKANMTIRGKSILKILILDASFWRYTNRLQTMVQWPRILEDVEKLNKKSYPLILPYPGVLVARHWTSWAMRLSPRCWPFAIIILLWFGSTKLGRSENCTSVPVEAVEP